MASSDSSHILIVYGSRYGQTAKIAHRMGEMIRKRGLRASVHDIRSLPLISLKDYDGVILGTPVYLTKTDRNLQQWVLKNKNSLSLLKSGLFTVSLNAGSQTPEAPKANLEILEQFQKKACWQAGVTATLIGALKFREYNPLVRFFLKRISAKEGGPTDTSRDHELTRWEDVEAFVGNFLQQLSAPSTESKFFPGAQGMSGKSLL